MIEFIITQQMIDDAKQRAKNMGILKNSISHGKGTVAGFIGEVAVANYLGVPLCNTYDYDLIYNDLKIDVKTKHCSVTPLPHYDCSVAAYNTRQQCDVYIFVRVLMDYKKGWILGGISKEDYFKSSRFMKQGTVDSSNGFMVKADCYNLEIGKLLDVTK